MPVLAAPPILGSWLGVVVLVVGLSILIRRLAARSEAPPEIGRRALAPGARDRAEGVDPWRS